MPRRAAGYAPISKTLVEQHEHLLTIGVFKLELTAVVRICRDLKVDIEAKLFPY